MKKFLLGLIIVFSILYFSKFALGLLHLQFPAPVFGIILLFILLETKVIKAEWVETFSEFILKYMILFFIPLFVGVASYYELLSKNIIPILAAIFVSTFLIMAFVAVTVEYLTKYYRLYRFKRRK